MIKLGYSLPEILSHFNELFKNKDRESTYKYDVPIGGKLKPIEVYEIPLDLPRYRLANTRTIALQEQYIAENKLSEDYFEKDPLSDKLQEIQHNILQKLIDRKDLKEYFTTNEQTQPLILTHEGFVISGNRRLCAFRELFYGTKEGCVKFKRFERIRVVILPKLTDEEIEYIEDYYEQQQDIQDEFSWITRALAFEKRLQKHGYNVEILAERSNIKKLIIEDLLNKLLLANEYLLFIGKEKSYNLIEKDEFAFKEILKARKKFDNDPVRKEFFQKSSFLALKNQAQISGRMYKNIPTIQEYLDDIINEIKDNFSDKIYGSAVNKPLIQASDNLLNTLVGNAKNENDYILPLLDNPENESEIFDIINDIVDEKKNSKIEINRRKAVLKKIQKAHKELNDAYVFLDKETNKEGISEQLDNIEKIIGDLRKWLLND